MSTTSTCELKEAYVLSGLLLFRLCVAIHSLNGNRVEFPPNAFVHFSAEFTSLSSVRMVLFYSNTPPQHFVTTERFTTQLRASGRPELGARGVSI